MPDINNHPKGPLVPMRGKNKSRGLYRLHYVQPNFCTIGCGHLADPNRYTTIDTALDYQNLTDTQDCYLCGKHSRVPQEWLHPLYGKTTAAPDHANDSTDSDSSDTTSTDSGAPQFEPSASTS